MSTPKTLADMTHEEQTQCVGMWCDFYPGEFVKEGQKPQLGIIADWHLNREEATILNSGDTVSRTWSAGRNVTPRFDLPRAWNPDGTPVEGDWLTGKMQIDPTAPGARYDKATNTIHGMTVLNTGLPEDQHDWRVFVTKGEPLK